MTTPQPSRVSSVEADTVRHVLGSTERRFAPLNVLLLYAMQSSFTNTVSQHLLAFSENSRHQFLYMDAVNDAKCTCDLNLFDAVVIHYSCGLYHDGYFSKHFEQALGEYSGLKIVFVQDEYDNTEALRGKLERLAIDVLYTCVPEEYVDAIYPKSRFASLERITNLTGYVHHTHEIPIRSKPLPEREVWIGYRGRPLHLRYGDLARQKVLIGEKMLTICQQRSIVCDIKWDEQGRIYWQEWNDFLGNCRAVLGTESGSNVFDFNGNIKKDIDAAREIDPTLSDEQLYEQYVSPHEGAYAVMNQISPKIFESIGYGAGLILFEGEYSGILEPWTHYLPLKQDFANIDDVLSKLHDDEFMQNMTQRAFRDIIESGKYSYHKFITEFDSMLERRISSGRGTIFISSVVVAHKKQISWAVAPVDEPEKWLEQVSDYMDNVVQVMPLDDSRVNVPHVRPIFNAERDLIRAIVKSDARGSWQTNYIPPALLRFCRSLGSATKITKFSGLANRTSVRPSAQHLAKAYGIAPRLHGLLEFVLVGWSMLPESWRRFLKVPVFNVLAKIKRRNSEK